MKRNNKQVFENLTITAAAAGGKAIARTSEGRVIFVGLAVPGDVVDIEVYKKKKAYFEGKVIKFHSYSDKRTKPVCGHFGVCGGCKWQHMQYEEQLVFKQKEVTDNLLRIGHLELPESNPIKGCAEIYRYRNKMEYSFSDSRWLSLDEIASGKEIENKYACGFHIPGMWDKILDVKECHLQAAPSDAIRNSIRDFAAENGFSFFNPRKQEGLLRTLLIRMTSLGEIMVVLQFFYDDPEKRNLLLNFVKERFPEITSLQYIINGKGNDTIYDQEVILFTGRDHIMEQMEGLRFKINAKSFYQTNSVQAYELYKIARDFAGLTGKETVYDLYTGTGTIALFIARLAKKVIGIESVPEAIADAKENAVSNHIDNVSFFVGDMARVFTEDFIAQNGKPDVIITDPPRDGMHKNVVEQLLSVLPERIVYVSCNSATQARDLALMCEQYEIASTQAVDMFPQTHHVENVVLLKRK
jgi:23S rRNA (uracil1939-C5)-methyltransferase